MADLLCGDCSATKLELASPVVQLPNDTPDWKLEAEKLMATMLECACVYMCVHLCVRARARARMCAGGRAGGDWAGRQAGRVGGKMGGVWRRWVLSAARDASTDLGRPIGRRKTRGSRHTFDSRRC